MVYYKITSRKLSTSFFFNHSKITKKGLDSNYVKMNEGGAVQGLGQAIY